VLSVDARGGESNCCAFVKRGYAHHQTKSRNTHL
jgi:hypothetical protein